jgi:hypothetical protein
LRKQNSRVIRTPPNEPAEKEVEAKIEMVKPAANETCNVKGTGFDLQFYMHRSSCVEDPVKVEPLSAYDNPLRALNVPKAAVLALNNVIAQMIEITA